jgi:hypothetical protein
VLRRLVVALLLVVSAGVSTAAGRVLLNANHVHKLDIARMHRLRPPPLAISTRSAEYWGKMCPRETTRKRFSR